MALQVPRQIGLVLSADSQAQHWLRCGIGEGGQGAFGLGVCYKPELHFAIGHMRRWDGAYPPLVNGTKAVDLLQTDDKKARSVILA